MAIMEREKVRGERGQRTTCLPEHERGASSSEDWTTAFTAESSREITSCPEQSAALWDAAAPCMTTRRDGATEEEEEEKRASKRGREAVGGSGGWGG